MDGLCTVLILLLHHFLILRWQIFLPFFHTYRQKGNTLIDFEYLMHVHQMVETILVSNIRCATKFPLFFLWKCNCIVKKWLQMNTQSIAHRQLQFLLIFPVELEYRYGKSVHLLKLSKNKAFIDVFIWAELLISQTMCHRPEQVIIGRRNIWGTRRVR